MAAVAAPDVFNDGFIGARNMAGSITRRVAKFGVLPPSSIRTTHCHTERRLVLESFGVKILETNAQVVDDSDIIILSVKPQIVKKVLLEPKPFFSEEKVLVAIAAGIKLKNLQVLGAAAMVNLAGRHPGQLKDAVTSPAGTTIAGVQELERGSFPDTLMNAVVAATKQCQEPSQTLQCQVALL